MIQPGGYTYTELAMDLGALPPGDATHVVRINTNAPYTAAALAFASYTASASPTSAVTTGITLTVPWSVSVIQAFVFPDTLAYTAAPTLTAPAQLVSVVNFAGAPILVTARLPAAASSWLYLDTADVWLPDSGVLSMGVSASYPILDGSAAMLDTYIRNATVSLWREVDEVTVVALSVSQLMGLVNITDASLLSTDTVYVLVALYNITLNVTAQVGAPYAPHCSARA